MKKLFFILSLAFATTLITNAQIFKEAQKILGKKENFTQAEAAQGIKEALINGTSESVKLVSNVNGYFKNPEIKIPLPPDALIVESKLRSIGLGSKVDDVILSINRAAEDAATEAKPIFVAAIKNMSIGDAIQIVRGENNAATQYLKNNTSSELNSKFRPVIRTSLKKVNATRYWKDLVNTYNKIPLVTKINPNLDEYVTSKAIDGLFIMIAKEELKIRKDPVARTTELLRKIFGS